ncbi:hypothetical protein M378DRAFT_530064 [Amanita muscaria Koide BX008]|uniref:Uncharacterized protein n=1 Tax=Amanita muscaria (strain Koide BX008) TaxID=946122 RepID=A0A0C2SQE4_AMAMK|nr:hypothetical protein M378DRAFT_530064 [Amanita muscaria Koide BX008]
MNETCFNPRAEVVFDDYQNKKKGGLCFESTRMALLREMDVLLTEWGSVATTKDPQEQLHILMLDLQRAVVQLRPRPTLSALTHWMNAMRMVSLLLSSSSRTCHHSTAILTLQGRAHYSFMTIPTSHLG